MSFMTSTFPHDTLKMFNSFFQKLKNTTWKRWQLFHATDFQSLMYPNFMFCRILGIFPYKINASTFETSRQCYILPTFLICIVCIVDLKILYEIFANAVQFKDITRYLEGTAFFVFNGFIAFVTYVLSGPRMRVLQAMLNISSRLSPESYQKLSRWIHVKDILGTFFVIVLECIANFRDAEELLDINVLASYMSPLTFQMNMQYMNCICVLKACFKKINDNLVHMQEIAVNNEPYAPRLICHTQKNQFLLTELRTLKKQHLMASNTWQMLNLIFSLQLLTTTALIFTEITFEMYDHLMQWQGGLSIGQDDKMYDYFFIIRTAFEFSKLILIAWACEISKNQAFEVSTTVHDVLNRTSDNQIKEELHLFSLQILHRKNAFSTKGLSVDATLLAMITGSITTYLIILAQFMIIEHSCDGTTISNITQIT